MRKCSVSECTNAYYARDFCQSHLDEARRKGELNDRHADCEVCGGSFVMKKSDQRFCTRECSKKHYRNKVSEDRISFDPVEDAEMLVAQALATATVDANTECWEWPTTTKEGYSGASPYGITWHRLMCTVSYGKHLGSLMAHHKCANRRCVNPDHLQAVTEENNSAEMFARKGYIRRIKKLEEALAQLDPNHSLLDTHTTP